MALYAFDGTWNSEKDAGEYDKNTNVVRFKDLYAGPKYFYKGVGTKHGFLGKVAGGAFGVGGHERIDEAKRDVAKQIASGDRDIDITGFSRGAAIAVHDDGTIGLAIGTSTGSSSALEYSRSISSAVRCGDSSNRRRNCDG